MFNKLKQLFLNLFKKDHGASQDIVMGFWDELPEKSVIMAPMADVTDSAFRKIIAKYSRTGQEGGGPDAFYTEFVAADGLASDKGRPKLMHNFIYSEAERPIMAQIFSCNPKNMEDAARLCVDLGFDGIDLNMGCPERNICKQGAGSAMIKTPEKAKAVIAAAKRGAQGKIPVSVKTRVGWTQNEIETWIPAILESDVAAIILHGRTRKVMSKVPANWDWIARAAEIVRESGKPTKFIGNGDIMSLSQAYEYIDKYKVDGALVARGIFGNPWFFDKNKKTVTVKEKLDVMLEHTRIFIEELGEHKNFAVMKKHYKAYVNGFDGAKDLRVKLMDSNSYEEIETYVDEFLTVHPEVGKVELPC
jgi:nifR3 family TIM-barrel protein